MTHLVIGLMFGNRDKSEESYRKRRDCQGFGGLEGKGFRYRETGQESNSRYVFETEYASSNAPTALSPSPPPGNADTTEKSPSAEASVGAQAGHPATSAEKKAPNAAIPVSLRRKPPKVRKR